jgi:hypothetical protein
MELNREEVLRVLGNIIEPDLKKDIVSLNLILVVLDTLSKRMVHWIRKVR